MRVSNKSLDYEPNQPNWEKDGRGRGLVQLRGRPGEYHSIVAGPDRDGRYAVESMGYKLEIYNGVALFPVLNGPAISPITIGKSEWTMNDSGKICGTGLTFYTPEQAKKLHQWLGEYLEQSNA